MKAKIIFRQLVIFSIIVLASACQVSGKATELKAPLSTAQENQSSGKTVLPEYLQETVQKTWEHYKWYDENNGFPRGGGWHLKSGDENKPFEITQARQGKLPEELKALMVVSSTGYEDGVWCVAIKPPLYQGMGKEARDDLIFQNMLFFHRKDGSWVELGNTWKERWVAYLYDSDVYGVSINFYLGTNQKMYEKVGCDNWQGK